MFCQKVHKPNTFLECTTHYQAYRKKQYSKHYKNSIWSLELTQVDAETKRFRSKCSPGNKHTKTLTQWWIFPKKTTLNIDTERSEMKNHKGWRRRNRFYRSQDASVCVWARACVCVCVCVRVRVCVLQEYGGKHEACLAVSVLLPHQLDSASQWHPNSQTHPSDPEQSASVHVCTQAHEDVCVCQEN